MTEKNVDRLWFVVGVVVVGSIVVFVFRDQIGIIINRIIEGISSALLQSDAEITYPSDSSDMPNIGGVFWFY